MGLSSPAPVGPILKPESGPGHTVVHYRTSAGRAVTLICRDGPVAVATTEIVLVQFSTNQTLNSNADNIGEGGFARIIVSMNVIGGNLAFILADVFNLLRLV